MRLKKWQVQAITTKLDQLRQKWEDPETGHCRENDPESGFNREWCQWVQETPWARPHIQQIANQLRRDNVERKTLQIDDAGTLIPDPQGVLALDLEDSVIVRAPNIRRADWQDHKAMKRVQLHQLQDATARHIRACDVEQAKHQTEEERWFDVLKREGK